MGEVSLFTGKRMINADKWALNANTDVTLFVSSNALENNPLTALSTKSDLDYWMSGNFIDSYIMFNFASPSTIPVAFEFSVPALEVDQQKCRFTPQKVAFYGSNNGMNWDRLGEYSDFKSDVVKDKVFRCEVNCKKVYQFLKIQQEGTNMAGTYTFTLSYVNILSKNYTKRKGRK